MQDSVTFDAKTAMEAYRTAFENGCSEFSDPLPRNRVVRSVRYLDGIGGQAFASGPGDGGLRSFRRAARRSLPARLAVELFHNFTLMHDDIMDDAPLRRGKPTVHEKWDNNTAILSGDALHVMACEALLDAPDKALPDLVAHLPPHGP